MSSAGEIRGKNLPGANNLDPNSICYWHSLAVDERCVKFLPRVCMKVERHVDKGGSTTSRVKEVWSAGCHSDMCCLIFPALLMPLWLTVVHSGGSEQCSRP